MFIAQVHVVMPDGGSLTFYVRDFWEASLKGNLDTLLAEKIIVDYSVDPIDGPYDASDLFQILKGRKRRDTRERDAATTVFNELFYQRKTSD